MKYKTQDIQDIYPFDLNCFHNESAIDAVKRLLSLVKQIHCINIKNMYMDKRRIENKVLIQLVRISFKEMGIKGIVSLSKSDNVINIKVVP